MAGTRLHMLTTANANACAADTAPDVTNNHFPPLCARRLPHRAQLQRPRGFNTLAPHRGPPSQHSRLPMCFCRARLSRHRHELQVAVQVQVQVLARRRPRHHHHERSTHHRHHNCRLPPHHPPRVPHASRHNTREPLPIRAYARRCSPLHRHPRHATARRVCSPPAQVPRAS